MKHTKLTKDFKKQILEIQNEMIEDHTLGQRSGAKVYLMTVVYIDCFSELEARNKVTKINEFQDKFFGYMLNKTVPRYSKPKNRRLQPVSLDFVDFPGTRKNRANTLKPPHIHSIVIVPPETQDRFELLCRKLEKSIPIDEKTNSIQSFDCQLIRDLADIEKTVSYASKFYQWPSGQFMSKEIGTQLFAARGGEKAHRVAKPILKNAI